MKTNGIPNSTISTTPRALSTQPKFRPFSGGANIHTLSSLPTSDSQRIVRLTEKVGEATKILDGISARRASSSKNLQNSSPDSQVKIDELIEKSQFAIPEVEAVLKKSKAVHEKAERFQQQSILSIIFSPVLSVVSYIKNKVVKIFKWLVGLFYNK